MGAERACEARATGAAARSSDQSLTGRWGERGAASVEQAALVALIAVATIVAIAALASRGELDAGRELGGTLGRKVRCAARSPGPCWRDPLTAAYGRPLAGLVRALAPAPATRTGPSGLPLVGVDFRRCRRESCAVPLPGPRGKHLTRSNRRTAAFTSVEHRRRAGGDVRISYWIYRPRLGWERIVRRAASAEVETYARTPLPDDADPRLIPLETLPGRNHYEFRVAEEPPWRWRVEGVDPF